MASTYNPGSNVIYCNTSRRIWLAWFFALFINAMTLFALIMGSGNLLRAVQEHPVLYFFAIFPIIGLLTLASAIRETWAWFKFGRIPLILETIPLRLNQPMRGYLPLPEKITQLSQAKLTLTCFHEYLDRTSTEDQHRKKAIWQDSKTTVPERFGVENRINFDFSAPKNLPASSAQGEEKYSWALRIAMPLAGLDFDRTFEIPVFEAINQTEDAHHAVVSDNQGLSHADNALYQVPEIDRLPGGIQFHYGYGRSKGMSLALMVAACFLGGFCWVFFQGFDNFLPVTLMLLKGYVLAFTGLIFLLGLFMVANSLTIAVGLDGITRHQKILGFTLTEYVPKDSIADITTEESGSSTYGNETRVWYSLKLHTIDGKKLEVGDSIENYSHAQAVRETMIGALGRNWQATEVNNKPIAKLPMPVWAKKLVGTLKILKYAVPIALLYDLKDVVAALLKIAAETAR